MTITKNVSNYNDVLLDIQTQFGTISQQPTANSQQPTANSQQPTANSQQPNFNQNNILFYVNKFINEESSLGNFLCDSFALQIIRWLLFFYALAVLIGNVNSTKRPVWEVKIKQIKKE